MSIEPSDNSMLENLRRAAAAAESSLCCYSQNCVVVLRCYLEPLAQCAVHLQVRRAATRFGRVKWTRRSCGGAAGGQNFGRWWMVGAVGRSRRPRGQKPRLPADLKAAMMTTPKKGRPYNISQQRQKWQAQFFECVPWARHARPATSAPRRDSMHLRSSVSVSLAPAKW